MKRKKASAKRQSSTLRWQKRVLGVPLPRWAWIERLPKTRKATT